MKAKQFMYREYLFKPIGNIVGNVFKKMEFVNTNDFIKPKDFSYEGFYKQARAAHACCDVFEVFTKQKDRIFHSCGLYMPNYVGLNGVMQSAPIKKLEEYTRWYH